MAESIFKPTKLKVVVLLLLVVGAAGIAYSVFVTKRGADPQALLARAEEYYGESKFEEAKLLYQKVLQSEPNNAMAVSRLGTICYDQGSQLRALYLLGRARELSPDDIDVRMKLASALYGLGDFTSARSEALEILARQNDHGRALRLLANSSRTPEEIEEVEERLAGLGVETADSLLASATIAMRKGDMETANAKGARALEVDPESVGALIFDASARVAQGDLEGASVAYNKAASLSPLRSAIQLRAIEHEMRSGNAEAAKQRLETLTKEVPDFVSAWLVYARVVASEGKPDEALTLLDNAFRYDPTFYGGTVFKAQLLLATKEVDKALPILTHLVENVKIPNPRVEYMLAQARLAKGEPEPAEEALNRLLRMAPGHIEGQILLARLQLLTGRPEQVVESMGKLMKQRPDIESIHVVLADAYRMLGRYEDAAQLFRAKIEEKPEAFLPRLFLGVVLLQQKKDAEARTVFEELREAHPENPIAEQQLFELDLKEKQFAAANARVEKMMAEAPSNPGLHVLGGRVELAQENWDAAEAAFLKAIETDPKFSPAYEMLTRTYVVSGQLDRALASAEDAVAKEPQNLSALLRVAGLQQEMGKLEEARASYESIVSLDPENIAALNNLAWLYSEKFDDLEKGLEKAQQAATYGSEVGAVQDTLGWILFKKGDYQKALFHLRDAGAKLPEDPVVQFHLGKANFTVGNREAARVALGVTASASDEIEEKREAIEMLAAIDGGGDALVSLEALEARYASGEKDVGLLIELGDAYAAKGAAQKAADRYSETLEVNPEHVGAMTSLARLYAGALDKPEEAIKIARSARELAPDDPDVSALLGKIAYAQGDFDLAYSLLGDVVEDRANDPALLVDFAWAAYSLGKVEEARGAMSKVMKTGQATELAKGAARFLMMTVVTPDTLSSLAETAGGVLESEPEYVPALMVRAQATLEQGAASQAATMLEKVIGIYPQFAPAQALLASAYMELPDKLDEALTLATEAREVLGDQRELTETLAIISYKSGEFGYAADLFGDLEEGGALPPASLFYQGMAQLKAQRTAEAQITLKRAIDGGLQEPHAATAAEALAKLEP